MNNTVMVFGGAGYIGSHTCKELALSGFRVVVIDDLSTGHHDAVQWGVLEIGSLLDREFLRRIVARHSPCIAIQFAAKISVGESALDPSIYYETNVIGSLYLLDVLRVAGNVPLVYSSTAAVYGLPDSVPISEDHAIAPINAYGRTKAIIEQALADYRSAYGFRSVAFRYFNASGADRDADIGEAHEPETHLIPIALDVAIGRIERLIINGDNYPTPDGTCIRDYVHVSDLADAHVAAVRYLLDGGDATVMNLGTGTGYSVLEIIAEVERVTGRYVARVFGKRRDGDPASLIASPELAHRVLAWRATRSGIENIVETAWLWHQKLRTIERNL